MMTADLFLKPSHPNPNPEPEVVKNFLGLLKALYNRYSRVVFYKAEATGVVTRIPVCVLYKIPMVN